MAARPRIRRRANWPENMHEPRPGYYVWRNPITKKTIALGYVPVQQAIFEVTEANAKAKEIAPTKRLVERMAEGNETIAGLLKKMPTKGMKQTTLNTRKYLDNAIRDAIGNVRCIDLTTKHIADMLEPLKEAGKERTAKAIRNRLITMCKKGAALGLMEGNPAAVTERVWAQTKRKRLSMEQFKAIFEKAPEAAPWLQNAMLLALVSGQDRSTIARWPINSVKDGCACVQRSKTSVKIEIPVDLRMDVMGLTLADVIARCKSTGIISKYLVHHVRNEGRAVRGSHIKLGTISEKFKEARNLAGIHGEHAPTFHEIRSLSKRTYDAQGNVDTKALLGHMTDEMAEMYANNRGLEPVRVSIKAG